jgi:hypothetical protein
MTGSVDITTATADFPDWISPMLVKELRQGMRSRVFLVSFMILQAAMIFVALIGLLNTSDSDSNTGVTVFYWLIVGIPLAIIMPSSGLGAIAREKMANTLEPIFLTRLTARRILIGKWVAIVVQTLLLVSAILPYTVLRYYMEGVNLVSELAALAWLTAGSMLLTAVTVGVSPMIGRFGRVIIPFAIFIFVYIGVAVLAQVMNPLVRGSGWHTGWWVDVALVLQGVLLAAMMLESGAGKIAPPAENHSTSKRLVGLAAAAIAIGCSFVQGVPYPVIWWPSLVIAGLTMVAAICEPVSEVPSVYRPFVRRGAAGRALGRLFYPGWPSGVLFSLVLAGLLIFRINQLATAPAAAPMHGVHYRMAGSVTWSLSMGTTGHSPLALLAHITEAAYIGALFLPMVIYRLLRVKKVPALIFFFGFHIVFSFVALFGAMATSYGRTSAMQELLAWIPTCAIWYQSVVHSWDLTSQGIILTVLSAIAFFSIVGLLILMRSPWREISALEKTAGGPAPDSTPTNVPGPVEAA